MGSIKGFFKKAAIGITVGFLACTFIDASMAAMVATGNDPFQIFMTEEAVDTRIPVEELPEGCHYHIGSEEPHCGLDAPLDIEF